MFLLNTTTNRAGVERTGARLEIAAVNRDHSTGGSMKNYAGSRSESGHETADELLERLRKELVSNVVKRSGENGAGLPSQLEELLAAMSATLYDESLNVKTLKATCRARDNNISTQFKHHCRQSIKDCIESCRMSAAAEVLAACDEPITEVAYRIGYSHVQTFQRAFRRRFNCTPGKYREVTRNCRDSETGSISPALCEAAV
jgi:AraC-like DNA-binding protein